eukprot:gb/GFBE01069644.1/.p1 GENE.gb/GFBE01069644.1/~~gb/GFBE01069644.1/.p1  ORF type:complete len:302 (+),score=42.06 gb/GFBE01069644.1/:1-906(+)
MERICGRLFVLLALSSTPWLADGVRTTTADFATQGPQKDYYAVLGVEPTAAKFQIRRAYRALVAKFPVEVTRGNPVAEQRATDIMEAYHVLTNSARRAAYDLSLARRPRWPRRGGRRRNPWRRPHSTLRTSSPNTRYCSSKGSMYVYGSGQCKCNEGMICFKNNASFPGCGALDVNMFSPYCKDCECKESASSKCGKHYCGPGSECHDGDWFKNFGSEPASQCRCLTNHIRDPITPKDVEVYKCSKAPKDKRCCQSPKTLEYRWFAHEDLAEKWGKKVCPTIDDVKWKHAAAFQRCDKARS